MAFAHPREKPPRPPPTHGHMSLDEALANAYFKYGAFGSTGNPSFRSRE